MLQFLIFIVHFMCLMELPIPTSLVDRSISKSLKIEIIGLDIFLFPKIKKNPKNLKRMKLI